jgi:hypothetical protein
MDKPIATRRKILLSIDASLSIPTGYHADTVTKHRYLTQLHLPTTSDE